jgi:hypothetical protein
MVTSNIKVAYPKLPELPELEAFLAKDYPETRQIIGPIQSQQVIMCAAATGIGKTQLAVALAYSVTTGRPLFDWKIPEPVSVLFVDGEMSGRQLQDRLRLYSWPEERQPLHLFNSISWAADQGLEQPNLAKVECQDMICRLAQGKSLVLLDNVMSLVSVPGTSFSSDEFWRTVFPLNLRLRAMGCTVIWFDHTNREGTPFGTSTKQWQADLVFTLERNKKSADFEDRPGAAFKLAFIKVRGAKERHHRTMNVQMTLDAEGRVIWTHSADVDRRLAKVAELLALGRSRREIMRELDISLGTAQALCKKVEMGVEFAQ